MSKILVLAEQQNGKVTKSSKCAITAAKQLAKKTGGSFSIALAGHGIDGQAGELTGHGADRVLQLENPALLGYTAQAYSQAYAAAAKAMGAQFVVSAATAVGKDLSPRVAARLGAGQASEILSIEGTGGDIYYRRPMWAGNVIAGVRIKTPIQVITVRGTEFDADPGGAGQSPVERVSAEVDTGSLRMKYLGIDAIVSNRPELADANVVVSGGRGLKDPGNFKLVERLADVLGGAVGATRAVVDAGWVPNDWQIGQTGKVVAPSLYIAIGISGAIQHVAGMKGSKVIVAINKDEEAPIFGVADYGLVADLFGVVPELTEKLTARRG